MNCLLFIKPPIQYFYLFILNLETVKIAKGLDFSAAPNRRAPPDQTAPPMDRWAHGFACLVSFWGSPKMRAQTTAMWVVVLPRSTLSRSGTGGGGGLV